MTKAEIFDAMTQFIGDDVDLKADIYKDFLSESAKMFVDAGAALEKGDFTELRRQAHTLKGCCANVGAEPLRALSYDWQIAAEKKDAARCRALLDALKAEFAKLEP